MNKNTTKKVLYDILKIHHNLRRSPEAYNILLVNILILAIVLIGGFFIIIMQDPVIFSCIVIIIKTFVDVYSQRRHEIKMLKRINEHSAKTDN